MEKLRAACLFAVMQSFFNLSIASLTLCDSFFGLPLLQKHQYLRGRLWDSLILTMDEISPSNSTIAVIFSKAIDLIFSPMSSAEEFLRIIPLSVTNVV
jgi:hypothetical protein